MSRISAILCTHNRATYLQQALESLVRQTLSLNEYDIIIVDNASSDSTVDVINDFTKRYGNIHHIREDRLGLSYARNTGAIFASSPYVAYIDDDALADPLWLENILIAFENLTPSPAAVGGKVFLSWGGEPPSWLPKRYYWAYSHYDRGDDGFFLPPKRSVVGANMAFNKSILLDFGGFNTYLGRKGKNLLSSEEDMLIRTLHDHDYPIYYVPDAYVWHCIHKNRQRRFWFWSRIFWEGASQPIAEYGLNRSRRFYLSQGFIDIIEMKNIIWKAFNLLIRKDVNGFTNTYLSLFNYMGRLRTNALCAYGYDFD